MTTVDQGINRDDADRLFLQGVTGAASATALLEQYGPGVDAWPTGYKTLQFGREGTENDPAAAVSIAAAGALAVRAEAGIGGAAGAFGSHARLIGATLQSTVMDAALTSLGVGGGRVVTLSIAANLADAGASPRLADTLLSKGTLTGIFGESVNDAGKGSSTAASDSWGEAGTRAGNKLHFVEPDELVAKSGEELRKYLAKYYGQQTIQNHPDLINACAYGALARRTGASGKYPGDPSARVWLGALVESCNALQAKLPQGRTLESVLPRACYDQYVLAMGLRVAGRPKGREEPTLTTRSLPERQRTVAEAIALDFKPGIPARGSIRRGAAGDGGASELAAMSYSGQREQRLAGSTNQQYLDLIRKHLNAYTACREKAAAHQEHYRAERERIQAGILGMFTELPYIRPSNLRLVRESENSLGELLNADGPGAPIALLPGLVSRYPNSQEGVRVWQNDIAVTLAAAGIRRFDSLNDLRAFQLFLRQGRGTMAREHAAAHVLDNLGLLLCGGLEDLSPAQLARQGLRPGDMRLYQKLRGLITPDGSPWYHVDTLDHAPTHLLQHAADIINFNHDSIMPVGPQVHIRGKGMTPLQADGARHGKYTPNRSQRKRQETESLQQEQIRLQRDVAHVTRVASAYISRRYNMSVPSNTRLFSVLLECDLAERQGFLDMTPDLQAITAQRVGRIFAGVNAASLPEEARPIVQRVKEIQAEQRAGKSKIRQLFEDFSDPNGY